MRRATFAIIVCQVVAFGTNGYGDDQVPVERTDSLIRLKVTDPMLLGQVALSPDNRHLACWDGSDYAAGLLSIFDLQKNGGYRARRWMISRA